MTHSDDVLSLFERIGGVSDAYQDFARARHKLPPKPQPEPAHDTSAQVEPATAHLAIEPAPAQVQAPLVVDTLSPGTSATISMKELFARLLAEPAVTETSTSPLERLRTPPGSPAR